MTIVGFTFLILTLYLIALKAMSYFAYRLSEKNTEDYFIAGRDVGVFALIATTVASAVSTGTVVSGPSQFFAQGAGYLWVFFTATTVLIMMPLALRFWKLAKIKSFITPGQLLGDFYKSKSVQIVTALIGLASMIPYATAQMVAIGKTFEALTGGAVPYEVGVSIVTIAIAMYIWYGGSRAVIWTDTVQGVLFSLLLIATGFMAVKWAGGWDNVMEVLTVKHPDKVIFDIKISYFEFLPIGMAFFFLPYVWQRSYMARSPVTLAKTIAFMPFVVLILFSCTWLIGTSALSLFPEGMQDSDSVLGAIFNTHAPYFGAFVLVAAFSAGMSTVDSQLLSAGSLLTHDIKRKLIKRRMVARLRWRDNYKFARMATMVLLVGIYIWSRTLQNESVISLIILGVSLNIVFFPAVFGMFYWKKSTTSGALYSLILGIGAFFLKKMTPLGVYFPTELGGASWALIVAICVFVVLSLLTDSSKLEESRKDTQSILSVS